MNILIITGNHLRHLYIANAVHRAFGLAGLISEVRENIVPEPPEWLTKQDRKNFILHFAKRDAAEKVHYGPQDLPACPILRIAKEELNTEKTVRFLRSAAPEVVITFGCHMIKEPLFSALPHHTINLHGGLSPRYRGTMTLFWPFYFLEPTYAGSTFHYLTSEPDSGDIIHQTTPALEKNDGMHDVACKTILASAEDLLALLKIFKENGKWKLFKQKSAGKNFLTSDFKPEHLRVIYTLFNDDIVRHYMEGSLKTTSPDLIRQF